MRFYHLKIAILAILYSSCGYEIAAQDKYPKIPEFSGFDKKLFVVDTLLRGIDKNMIFYDKDDGFIYCLNFAKGEYFLLDKSLKIKQRINAKGSFVGNKTFYKTGDDIFKPTVYKYVYPWNKGIKINKLDVLDYDFIVKNYKIPKDEKYGEYDIDAIRSIIKKDMDNRLGTLKETINLRDHIICIGTKGEFFMLEYVFKTYYEEKPKKKNFIQYLYKEQIEKNLYQFDEVVLGNHGGGNHFSGWTIPYGYQYYTFKIDKDSVQFKWNTQTNSTRRIIQMRDLWGDRVLIYKEGENGGELYSIRKK